MKIYLRPLSLAALAVFSLLLLFYFTQTAREKSAPQLVSRYQIVTKTSPGFPVRLIIPSINVNANIQYVGVTQSGEMEVPGNAVDVGWFKLGSRPGERGSAVISGHFDGRNGEMGVFTNLYKLRVGNKLYIEDDKGKSITFVVRESRTYDPGYAEEIFTLNDNAYLNLITCDGIWDGVKKNYTKRLVIFTDATHL